MTRMGRAKRYVTAEFLKVLISSILIVLPLTVAVAIETGHPTLDRFQVVFVTMALVTIVAIALTHLISRWRGW